PRSGRTPCGPRGPWWDERGQCAPRALDGDGFVTRWHVLNVGRVGVTLPETSRHGVENWRKRDRTRVEPVVLIDRWQGDCATTAPFVTVRFDWQLDRGPN